MHNRYETGGEADDLQMETGPYNVGGVLLDRPFKIRRLGHFGLVSDDIAACFAFYRDILGFEASEEQDIAHLFPPDLKPSEEDPRNCTVHMLRHSAEHHTLVLFSRDLNQAMQKMLYGRDPLPEITANQITWQVGSLAEVVNGTGYIRRHGIRILDSGRDMPGSNWHVYLEDPDGFSNELYYGMEIVGWQGFSKPVSMYDRGFRATPPLPQISEREEVDGARLAGKDFEAGYRSRCVLPATYDVEGILLPRPFKIARIGPIGLFVDDVAASACFYRERLGFIPTASEIAASGEGIEFFRSNTEHHSLALAPMALRRSLGWEGDSKVAWFGVQFASYQQLREAINFLREKGFRVMGKIDPALHPGIEHAAIAFDPDGHALLLYWSMDQIGSDGAIPARRAPRLNQDGSWPAVLQPTPDAYCGETLIGPWA